jgi:hypothetical protein
VANQHARFDHRPVGEHDAFGQTQPAGDRRVQLNVASAGRSDPAEHREAGLHAADGGLADREREDALLLLVKEDGTRRQVRSLIYRFMLSAVVVVTVFRAVVVVAVFMAVVVVTVFIAVVVVAVLIAVVVAVLAAGRRDGECEQGGQAQKVREMYGHGRASRIAVRASLVRACAADMMSMK